MGRVWAVEFDLNLVWRMLSVLTSVLISSVLSLQLGSDGCEIGICFDVSCFSILFYFSCMFCAFREEEEEEEEEENTAHYELLQLRISIFCF
jgi:hypothetical protein